MQKTLIAVLFVLLFSCRAEEKKEPEAKTSAAASTTPLPYTATYSSKFEIGDSKHAEAILAVWKSWDDGNLSSSRKEFADSLHLYFRDGSEMSGPTDSIMKQAQAFRDMFTTVKSTVHAYMPLKSTDKNENWVTVWGTEVSTSKAGKVDSVGLQETWRLNKAGKVDLLYQFSRSLTPPPATK